MVQVSVSRKLRHAASQSRITSGTIVLLRLVQFGNSSTVMTATAPEDDESYMPYPKQDTLIEAAIAAFVPFSRDFSLKQDSSERPYVEFIEVPISAIHDAANTMARSLRLESIVEHAREEARDIYNAVGGAANEWEDAVYMGDGMWLTSDGDWVQR